MKPSAFKYLMGRVQDVRYANTIRQCVDPPEIRAIRKKLARYDTRQAKVIESRIAKRMKAITEAREVIHRGDYEKALAAIKQLEKTTF